MLRITQIQEIEDLLLQLPNIVRQQEQRSPDFAAIVEAWLKALEKAFVSNRLYLAGNIAALRSNLAVVERGEVPAGLEFRSRPSRMQVMSAVASQALQRASEIASAIIAENRPRLLEAERVAQQIVVAAISRGLITIQEEKASKAEYLKFLRRNLGTNDDLENGLVHLEGLVGPQDALILIDRALGC